MPSRSIGDRSGRPEAGAAADELIDCRLGLQTRQHPSAVDQGPVQVGDPDTVDADALVLGQAPPVHSDLRRESAGGSVIGDGELDRPGSGLDTRRQRFDTVEQRGRSGHRCQSAWSRGRDAPEPIAHGRIERVARPREPTVLGRRPVRRKITHRSIMNPAGDIRDGRPTRRPSACQAAEPLSRSRGSPFATGAVKALAGEHYPYDGLEVADCDFPDSGVGRRGVRLV